MSHQDSNLKKMQSEYKYTLGWVVFIAVLALIIFILQVVNVIPR